MAAGMLFSWILPHTLIGLFTTQESTVSIGVTALHYISFGFIVSAVSITVSGVLEGLGKGSQSLLVSLARYLIIIVPAAFLLSRIDVYKRQGAMSFDFSSMCFVKSALGLLKHKDMMYVRKDSMEKMGAAYMANGIVTLAGSRLYTSLSDTPEIIDEALNRFEEVFKHVKKTDKGLV